MSSRATGILMLGWRDDPPAPAAFCILRVRPTRHPMARHKPLRGEIMPTHAHKKAADLHEKCAKAHRTAAEHHEKNDHKAALEHSRTAVASSISAHESSIEAGKKSDEKARVAA